MTKPLDKRTLPREVRLAVKAALDKKSAGTVVLDLREVSGFTDWFVIAEGQSGRQNAAIQEAVEFTLKKAGTRPLGVEGMETAEWILIDYGWFVVHVFSPRSREYYSLDKLWGDAPKASF